MILVTGGAGFIGSVLVLRLAAEGERVRVLDDFSAEVSAARGERLAGLSGVEVLEGDIRDPGAVRNALAGVGRVVHLAAPSVRGAEEDPETAARGNIAGTLTVLGESRRAGVGSFVHASSYSVYGDAGDLPTTEATPPNPLSVHAATKLAGERHVLLHHRTGGPPAAALRFFSVYGPGPSPDSPGSGAPVRFAAAALSGTAPEIHGDGRQTRDFVSVSDAVEAVVRALDAAPGAAGGEAVNIGAGRAVSVLEVWRLAARAAGVALEPRFGPPRAGDLRHACANPEKAVALLGFRARVGLAEGIGELVSAAARAKAGRKDGGLAPPPTGMKP